MQLPGVQCGPRKKHCTPQPDKEMTWQLEGMIHSHRIRGIAYYCSLLSSMDDNELWLAFLRCPYSCGPRRQ